jgi:hypothetical protein
MPFPVSAALYFGVGDEHVEVEFGFASSYTGVHADCRFVVSGRRRCRQRVPSRVQRRLRAMRLAREWIELETPSARVDSKL